MSIEQKFKILFRTVMFFLALLACTLIWFSLQKQRTPPARFAKPTRLMPETAAGRMAPIADYKVSVARQKNAHAYFSRSCRLLDSADFLGALGFVDQAIAEDPGNPKYHKMARLVKAEIANQKLMNEIVRQIKSASYDQAWNNFDIACRDNYLFFSRYAGQFSALLEQNHQVASAATILLALSGEG